MLEFLKEYEIQVVFIVVLSYNLQKLSFLNKVPKFCIPLALAFLTAFLLFYTSPLAVVFSMGVQYAGKGMILFEIYKNIIRRKK